MHNLSNLFVLTVTLFFISFLTIDCVSLLQQPSHEAKESLRWSESSWVHSARRFSQFPSLEALALVCLELGFCFHLGSQQSAGDRNLLFIVDLEVTCGTMPAAGCWPLFTSFLILSAFQISAWRQPSSPALPWALSLLVTNAGSFNHWGRLCMNFWVPVDKLIGSHTIFRHLIFSVNHA